MIDLDNDEYIDPNFKIQELGFYKMKSGGICEVVYIDNDEDNFPVVVKHKRFKKLLIDLFTLEGEPAESSHYTDIYGNDDFLIVKYLGKEMPQENRNGGN